jgi:hexosaminidase
MFIGAGCLGFSVSGSASTLKSITLKVDQTRTDLRNEGYQLTIKNDTGVIIGKTSTGVFYGVQTLRQLLPPDIEKRQKVVGVAWSMPEITIQDTSRFPWRGTHLDVSRHFWTVAQVKTFLDLLAYYKLNRFQLHLTDDHGWRMEIKQYPKLTSIGAWRKEPDGSTYGGFYTQNDIKDIVAYATARGITVIPAIEIPGHATAALAAYPQLSCFGGPFQVVNSSGFGQVFTNIFCAGNDSTFIYLDNIIAEMAPLFPSKILNINGDECPKDAWNSCPKCQKRISDNKLADATALQAWFLKRIQSYCKTIGVKLMGWDDITEGGGLDTGAIIQYWRTDHSDIPVTEANAGQSVVMSPTFPYYFDYDYSWNNLNYVYGYDMILTGISQANAKNILGPESCLWSEWFSDMPGLEIHAFPRMFALAERGWVPSTTNNFSSFLERVGRHTTMLTNRGVSYYADPYLRPDTSHTKVPIIPLPASYQLGTGTALIDSTTVIYASDSITLFTGNYFAAAVAPATGYFLQVKLKTGTSVAFSPCSIGVEQSPRMLKGGTVLRVFSVEPPELLNLKGQVVAKGEKVSGSEYRFAVSSLSKGIYMVILHSNNGKTSYGRIVQLPF